MELNLQFFAYDDTSGYEWNVHYIPRGTARESATLTDIVTLTDDATQLGFETSFTTDTVAKIKNQGRETEKASGFKEDILFTARFQTDKSSGDQPTGQAFILDPTQHLGKGTFDVIITHVPSDTHQVVAVELVEASRQSTEANGFEEYQVRLNAHSKREVYTMPTT